MFMGNDKEGKRLAFSVAREKETKAVFSTVEPRKSTGEWFVAPIGTRKRPKALPRHVCACSAVNFSET